MDEAFESDLRIGGNRQPRVRHVDHLQGLPENSPGRFVLALPVGDLQPGEHEQRGMHSHDHSDRAGLLALMIFRHDDAPVLAGRHHDGGDVRSLGLDSIAAAVDPAGIRVLHDHHAAGPDERATVMLVPDRRGNFVEIDRAAFQDVVQERAAVDLSRRKARRLLHVRTPPQDEVHLRALRRQPKRDIDAGDRGEDVCEHARAFGKAWNLVEHHGRISHASLIDVDNAADLFLGIGALDHLELACGFNAADPVPQILVGHCCFSRLRLRPHYPIPCSSMRGESGA